MNNKWNTYELLLKKNIIKWVKIEKSENSLLLLTTKNILHFWLIW